MKNFASFSRRMREIFDNRNVQEWVCAFDMAMNFMCQALEKHIRETPNRDFPHIEDIELHVLNYEDTNYPPNYNAEKNIFSFSAHLPSLTTMAATTRLKTEIEQMLHECGWTHMFVSISTFETGNHIIAKKIE